MKNRFKKLLYHPGFPYAFTGMVGVAWGMVGAWAERPIIGIVAAALIMLFLWGLLTLSEYNRSIYSGLLSGALLGLMLAIFSALTDGRVTSWQSGLMFGLLRGMMIGAIFGLLTRAKPEPDDPLPVRLFLLSGSLVIGLVSGGIVGIFTGYFVGLLQTHPFGLGIAFIIGAVVGGYLTSRSGRAVIIALGALAFGLLTVVGELVGTLASGIFLGTMSGALAPLMLMLVIGSYGGAQRSVRAVILDTLQTPREMIIQGAVPVFAPAMLIGLVLGTAVVGSESALVLPSLLGVLGMLLGAIEEGYGRLAPVVYPQTIIRRLIIGADRWPLRHLTQQIRSKRILLFRQCSIGALLGVVGSAAGVLLANFVLDAGIR